MLVGLSATIGPLSFLLLVFPAADFLSHIRILQETVSCLTNWDGLVIPLSRPRSLEATHGFRALENAGVFSKNRRPQLRSE
jgi:hypothetical protein